MNIVHRFWRSALLWVASGALLITSCKKSPDVTPVSPVGSTTAVSGVASDADVNKWILDSMSVFYYWNDKIPANPDKTQTPDKFFDSILYKWDRITRPDGDRFSWINKSSSELRSSLSGSSKTDGMEFQLYLRPGSSGDIIGSVLYVLPGSPADKVGIQRGDIFYSVDGQPITTANYQQIFSTLSNTDVHTYGFAQVQNGQLSNTSTTKQLTSVVFQENPVYKDSVYTIGGKTIGYFVYNQFINGPGGFSDNTYDKQVDNVFANFKAKGVNELVLDLRYNPGGSISSAVNLASLISPNANSSTIFAKYELNKQFMDAYRSQGVADQLNYKFSTKASNIGGNLQRVYIITSKRTASASELVINGLKPFMNVVTIGDTTVGKNVGSRTIYDPTGRIQWGMQPIIVKIFNSKGQSDYTAGFVPNARLSEPLNPRQFGDTKETMLSEAIYQITGNRMARLPAPAAAPSQALLSTIERKAGGSNMFVDGKLPGIKR